MNQNGMPCSPRAEEAVLGACLYGSPDVIDAVAELLRDEAWYAPRHREVWRAIWVLRSRMVQVDQVTVWNEIVSRGNPTNLEIGHVLGLMRETATDKMALVHAGIVADCWRRRQAIVEAQRLVERSRDLLENMDAVVADFARVPDILQGGDDTGVRWMATALDGAGAQVEEARDNPKAIRGVRTGLFSLDEILDGWQPGELMLVAGRPSMGKTALGLHFIRHAAGSCPVLMISAEMRAQALALRMLASESHMDSHRIRRGRITDGELEIMRTCKDRLAGLPIFVADRTFDVRTAILQARYARREKQVGLVVVDYLQLLRPAERADSREREVASLGRDMKRLAEELEIPIIAMAQLNRAVEARTNKRPQMSDLRESGALEQDADVVILLHRPAHYGEPTGIMDGKNLLEIIIAKHRNGAVGTVEAYYDLASGFIAPWSQRGSEMYRESSDRQAEGGE